MEHIASHNNTNNGDCIVGSTVVSPQNQHFDIYGVFTEPEIYRMGKLTRNENLKQAAYPFIVCLFFTRTFR